MKARLYEAKPLLELLRTAKAYLEEMQIEATPTGLKVSQLDPPRIVMVQAAIEEPEFNEYESDEQEKIGLLLSRMSILNRIKARDDLTIETKSNAVTLTIRREGREIEYTQTMVETTPHSAKVKVSEDATFQIDRDELKSILNKMGAADDTSFTIIARPTDRKLYFTNTFEAKKGERKIEVKLDETMQIPVKKDQTRPVIQDMQMPKGAMSTYLTDTVQKAIEHADQYVKITLATNQPMKIEKTPGEHTTITIYIAPKVE